MKFFVIFILFFHHLNCLAQRMEYNSEKELIICVFDLDALPRDKCNNIEILYIHESKVVSVSPHVINDDVIMREDDIKKALAAIKKFKNLKSLYFLNIHMTDIPNEILCLKGLQELQFNFLNHFNPQEQIGKLLKFKKLETLYLNISFIGDDKANVIKQSLPK